MIRTINVTDKPEEKPALEVSAKPMTAIIVLLVAGIIFLIVPHGQIFAAILIPLALFAYFSFRNYTQAAFYDDCFLFYDEAGAGTATRIDYDDIQEWDFQHNETGPVTLSVTVKDGSVMLKPVVNWQRMWSAFHQMAEKKEKAENHRDFIQKNTVINWSFHKKEKDIK